MVDKYNNKLSEIDESFILEDILKYVYEYYTNTKMLFILFSYQFILNPSKKKTFFEFYQVKKFFKRSQESVSIIFFQIIF